MSLPLLSPILRLISHTLTRGRRSPVPAGRSLLLTLLPVFIGILASCQTPQPITAEKPILTGLWTIEYEQSARSILEARGIPTDPTRTNVSKMQLKQKFYGEFEFKEDGHYSLLYKLEGKEKRDSGTFMLREQQGPRFILVARSDRKENAGLEEVLSIEFLKANLIRLQKDDDKELPPLIFEREVKK